LYQKYRGNQPLSVADMRNLLRKVKLRDDSPLRTKVAEVKAQWDKRKYRLDDFEITPQNEVGSDLVTPLGENVRPPVWTPDEEIIFGETGSSDIISGNVAETNNLINESMSQEI
jgi:hypothetical protein